MTVPFLRPLLLASLCVAGVDASAQPGAGSGAAMLRIGIRIERSCEIGAAARPQPGALPTVACNRPLAYQVSIDGVPAPDAATALALSLPAAGAAPRIPARYATVAF
ncbi:hypothetical protein J7373_03515 [Xanthomonas sp. A2111]|uniref:Uncharacterized protein n=1 Tax=Xanthomonas hawaiiensis TaxID=3003247 RepID=A0ABU2I8Y0_9XANT|nr:MULTISPECIES: hypothetical protein [unclassified Xanthomonas]MBO9827311.1 hypothetical protein [Xanthomonas sp. A2111]MBO9872659.1 hypothetical protein [Xanthomonas sp. D-93]MDS9994601.1 hypothetical protein [Xanthomonas sp. A2111]MDS9995176.1 hypothetical protein [Xanthomonas sp. A2111]WNH46292.1 hypothetical protein PG878_07530 [Xanthomonas sp. A6251]